MSKKNKEILAIIPARGKSKSIPRKNINDFAGFPLIAYSIAAGLQAKQVTRVIVSTDDSEIAQIAKEYGAEVPFIRPDEFAQDETPDLPVFEHALKWFKQNENYEPDIVLQLRPTSPIRPINCVDDAITILLDHPNADCVRGVVEAGQNPYKMWHIQKDGELKQLLEVDGIKEPYNTPRQALPMVYWQTGHIDAIRPRTILEKRSMTGDVLYPLIIDQSFTVDIDTMLDWQKAERIVIEGKSNIIFPGSKKRPFPRNVGLLLLDFDGVFTDDRVWVDENGKEMVAANRSDGLGLELIRKMMQIEVMVISKEKNPVVQARCDKLDIPFKQGIDTKVKVIEEIIKKRKISKEEVVYIGNDVNDLECVEEVGFFVAPSDAHDLVIRKADLVLKKRGGFGAIREFCDVLLAQN